MGNAKHPDGGYFTVNGWHRTCVFCNKLADSKEHVFPAWLIKRVPSLRASQHTVSLGNGAAATGYLHRPGAEAITLKIVCRYCNNGWMSQLQDAARPILLSLLDAGWRSLSMDEADIVRSWAIMTNVIIEFADYNTRTITQEELFKFKNEKHIPDWKIAIFCYYGLDFGGFNHVGWNPSGRSKLVAYSEKGYPITPVFDAQGTSFQVGSIGFITYRSRDSHHDVAWQEYVRRWAMSSLTPFSPLECAGTRPLDHLEVDRAFRALLPPALATSIRPQWATITERQSGKRQSIIPYIESE